MRNDACDFGFMSPSEAANALRVCESTLQRWRDRSEGPGFVRVGRRVFYPQQMLNQYIDEQTCFTNQRNVA